MGKLKLFFTVARLLFGLAILGAAAAKLTRQPMLVEAFTNLGYPMYLLTILGVAYILGLIAIFQSWFSVLQEWGYAGFSIALIGAVSSHLMAGDPAEKAIPAATLLVLLAVVYLLRDRMRRLTW